MSWETFDFGDIVEKIRGGGTPSKQNQEYWNGDIYWASVKDMEEGKYKLSSTQDKITQIGLENSASNLIPKDTLIIATRMGLGRAFINDVDLTINQDLKAIFPKKEFVYTKFLLWWYVNNSKYIESLGNGATVKGIRLEHLKAIKINLPPLPTQKRIASILSAYDDLIENNLKRIKLLEETAQNIYKEWFVNFRFPNYENTPINQETRLPEGWVKKKLEELTSLIHGYAFDAKRFTEEPTSVMVLRMGNFKEKGGLQLDKNVKYISKDYEFKQKYKLFAGDLIMVLSDVTRDGRIIGNVGILPDYGIEYALNQRVAKLECEDKIKTFLFCSLNSFDFKEHCKPRANGATVLNLKTIDVNEYPIIVPPDDIIEGFSRKVNSLLKITENLDLQNQKLKEARDIMLPRLMNRTIEV